MDLRQAVEGSKSGYASCARRCSCAVGASLSQQPTQACEWSELCVVKPERSHSPCRSDAPCEDKLNFAFLLAQSKLPAWHSHGPPDGHAGRVAYTFCANHRTDHPGAVWYSIIKTDSYGSTCRHGLKRALNALFQIQKPHDAHA